MNPYAFVPYPTHINRSAPRYSDRYEGHSGRLFCELEALTPLLVMDSTDRAGTDRSQVGRFMTSAGTGELIIPGTSLKGMVRSVFEVLLPSCVPVSKSQSLVDQAVAACNRGTWLCPACRTFGFLNVLRGHIHIGQATVHGSYERINPFQLIALESPKPRHEAFYRPNGNPAGRKFYFHHTHPSQACTEIDRQRGNWVEPVAGRKDGQPGTTFRFTVTFENLQEDELHALLAALTLSDRAPWKSEFVAVRHKLGYGKPTGLGSVEVRILQAELFDRTRYHRFAPGASIREGEALKTWVRSAQDRFFTKPTTEVQALINILRYPPEPGVTYQYPTWAWFKQNPRAPLSETP